MFPHGGPSLVSVTHPVYGEADASPADEITEDTVKQASRTLTTADLVRLLESGDKVLWPSRSIPLDVTGRNTTKETAYTTGVREIAFDIKGPQGGKYLLDVWHHFGEDGDVGHWDDCKGVYLQIHRTTDQAWEDGHHPNALAIDGPVAEGPGHHDGWDPGDIDKIIYSKPSTDEHYAGEVVGTEFGDLVVDPIDATPLVEAEHTVTPDDVLAYRWSP